MKRMFFVIFCLAVTNGCSRQASVNTTTATPSNTQIAAANATPVAASTTKSDRGTPDEAKAMLVKAVEHYNSVGRDTAFVDFTAKKPPFFDRDLYVACVDKNNKIVANGGFPNLVGTSTDAWRDADGHPLGKATRDAFDRGDDSIKYRWNNPINGKMEPKIFFFKKVGDDICGVGAYNP